MIDTKKIIATLEYSSAFDATPATLEIHTDSYADGSLAVCAVEARTREPYGHLSVNVGDHTELRPGEFYLKDWSENEELADALVLSGAIKPVLDQPAFHTGFVTAYCYRIAE